MLKLSQKDLADLGYNVKTFDSAQACLKHITNEKCHLLITDVKMPGMDGLTMLHKIKGIAPWIPVMVITGYGDVPIAVKAIKQGAVDFIEKPLERDYFLHKVKSFIEKSTFYNTNLANPLTKTEIKVLHMILQGMGNKQIAYKLNRSLRSAEMHRSNIMHKFGADNIVDLLKKAHFFDYQDAERIN
jgi:FixJ family two-component response regulator